MQKPRSQAEREMPEWEREALDRERSRPRDLYDVLGAIEKLQNTVHNIQAHIYGLEQALSQIGKAKSDERLDLR